MRIAVVYSHRAKIGGIESYLDTVISQLVKAGHAVCYWYETVIESPQGAISLPPGTPAWCVAEIGEPMAIDKLREWRPDLIYSQGLSNPSLDRKLLAIAPTVIFAHGYYGSCVSGAKSFKRPCETPCDRRFGRQCLVAYLPRRCGGLNPLTMIADYRKQKLRLDSLRRCAAVITASEHMRQEFIRNGLSSDRVSKLQLPLAGPTAQRPDNGTSAAAYAEAQQNNSPQHAWRILFLGRMTPLKGGHVLLAALTMVRAALDKPLHVTFAGEGPERSNWQQIANALNAADAGLQIEFVGWQQGDQLAAILCRPDLLVVPSLWPEPFGMVGPEAGLRGVPAAAFAVGGIPEWLADGVNGHLAPGDPPTTAGLAKAISRCLTNRDDHNQLRAGALRLAQQYDNDRHLNSLLELFQKVAGPTQ